MSDALEVTAKLLTDKPARKVKSAGVTGITGAARARATRQANQAGDHFRYKLVLNAWMIEQFGFSALPSNAKEIPIRNLGRSIALLTEGFGSDGLHCFYHAFKAALPITSKVTAADLLRYEENIAAHTTKINNGRSQKITWKYFQWLTLLFVEHYLDQFFNHQQPLLDKLNAFVPSFNAWRNKQGFIQPITEFTQQELNKVCLQNATGSGKTLLMHINLMQFSGYAKEVNNLGNYTRAILLTPNEDLTAQHLQGFSDSGITAQRFVADLLSSSGAELSNVDALELSKLGDEDKEKTVAVRNFGDSNLLLVDEGHVGLGSQNESGFLARRDALSAKGFVFEYSATFAQAVEAAKEDSVTQAYAKSVLFDYSYRYFYEDGYGKDYQIFNLAKDSYVSDDTRRLYLTASLLSFYQQLRLFDEQRVRFAEFNLEKPLWVFVGASVVKAIGGTKDETSVLSDVAEIVQFIANFLHDRSHSTKDIDLLLGQNGVNTGLLDSDGYDIFRSAFEFLKERRLAGENATGFYQDILTKLFNHTAGGTLTLTRIKGETSEVRLHVGSSEKPFGVINVGDAPELIKVLEKTCQHVVVDESEFATGTLFGDISASNSPVNLLVGSRKFISGWDCWRVSTLGLMHVGKSEGAQIIQLFGRGVRLKGHSWSLKRSSALTHLVPPKHIQIAETLGVFGVKSDYMQEFRKFLESEGLPGNEKKVTRTIPMNLVRDVGKRLQILQPKTKKTNGRDYDFKLDGQVPTFGHDIPKKLMQTPIVVNWYPRIQAIVAKANQNAPQITALNKAKLKREHLAFINWDDIWFTLETYKRQRDFTNMSIDRLTLPNLFADENNGWYDLQIPIEQLAMTDWRNVEIWQRVTIELLKRFLEAYYNYYKKAFYEPRLELKLLTEDHANMPADGDQYQLVVDASETALLQDIEKIQQEINQHGVGLITEGDFKAYKDGVHLISPLLHVARDCKVSISPVPLNDSEFGFVEGLNAFISSTQGQKQLAGCEVFLLRNKARGGGIGFFEAGAFYPDFILWILRDIKQYIAFVEPHGLKHETQLSPKLTFFKTIKDIEARVNLVPGRTKDNYVTLESFIVSPTPLNQLIWEWKTFDEFAENHVLMMDDSDYISRLFKAMLAN
jgi:hypothetical protein